MSALRLALTKIFPAACVLCGRAVSRSVDICVSCEQKLPRNHTRCSSCAYPVPVPVARCIFCQTKAWRFERCVCLLAYRPPATQLISAFKYQEKLSVGRTLSILLAQEILQRYTPEELPEAIFPMPLHTSRLRSRGFNQSMEMARTLSAHLGIPTARSLVIKTRATPSQVGLGVSARTKNMRHSFARADSHTYRHIALVDDVLTSGASAMAVARCLPRKTRIHLWCLARAV